MASVRKARGRQRMVWGALLIVALAALVVVGIRAGVLSLPSGHPAASPSHPLACTGDDCSLGPGVRGVELFVEPRDGATPILNAIRAATRSVWVEV
jgi:hypothetical protein